MWTLINSDICREGDLFVKKFIFLNILLQIIVHMRLKLSIIGEQCIMSFILNYHISIKR